MNSLLGRGRVVEIKRGQRSSEILVLIKTPTASLTKLLKTFNRMRLHNRRVLLNVKEPRKRRNRIRETR